MKLLIISILVLLSQQSFTFIDQTDFYKQLEPKTNFYTETGYVGVPDPKNGNNQFFYHLFLKEGVSKLEDVKKEDKFFLWLNGGPGCSALQHLFAYVGPYYLYKKGDNDYSVKKADNAWTTQAHVIFVDQPFEVGLSYSEPNLNIPGSDAGGLYMVEFFRVFFQNRPQFRETSFYVFGVSYGGHYVPALGAALAKSNLIMNFKGIAVGNGWTDAFLQSSSYAPLFYSIGVISEKTKELTEKQMALGMNDILNKDYKKATVDGFGGIFSIIDNYTGKISPYDFQDYWNQGPPVDMSEPFINQYKKQLGAPDTIVYATCSERVLLNFAEDISINQKENVEYLLNKGYKVMYYQGSIDIICNTPSVNALLNQLNWEYIYEWKKTPKTTFKAKNSDEEETAGTVKKHKNLYFATVYKGGHHSAKQMPIASLKVISHFLNDDEIWD